MKHFTTSLLFILLLVTACQKKQSDFVGKYSFHHAQAFELPDKDRSWSMLSALATDRKYRKPRTTAKSFTVLEPVVIDLFLDASNQQLKGEMEITDYERSRTNKSRLGYSNLDFTMNNFRITSDTLWFSFSSEDLRYMGKTHNGFVFFDNDENPLIGMDKELFDSDTVANPWYKNKSDRFVIYGKSNLSHVAKQFYTDQINELTANLQQAQPDTEKEYIIENSIEFLKNNFLDKE